MFIDFFLNLRSHKIPVTPGEFLDFLTALKNLTNIKGGLDSKTLYQVARSCLVKDIKYYDSYDLCFALTFKDCLGEENKLSKLVEEWLQNALKKSASDFTDEQKKKALHLPPKDLLNEFKKRLNEQKKKHQGGNHWVGTGGTSPFGHSGYNPAGIRVGGESSSKSAIATALGREYKEYRTDETLNIRQLKIALKKLRGLKKVGRKKISLTKTIKKTCHAGGELELVLESSRRNDMKLLLLMDIGGSMTPYAHLVNRLFSACHQLNHFKEFKSFYFHNIFYNNLYEDPYLRKKILLQNILNKYRPDTRVIIVGDAAMAPYELHSMNQKMFDYYETLHDSTSSNKNTGLSQSKFTSMNGFESLKELIHHFKNTIWLNPEPSKFWYGETTLDIKKLVPMYFLGIDGLQAGVKKLLS